MAQGMVTFDDIVDGIREAIGVQTSDTSAVNKIKRFVNMVYLDEVVPFKRWQWLQKSMTVVHKAYHNVGTASVTPTSTSVTLNTAPNSSLGSFKGYRFSVDGNNQVYTIASHTAGSAAVVLTGAYQEAVNGTANYKIWRDSFDLPTDAKETVELWHAERATPCEGVGPQGFRKLEAASPKAEGFPSRYNTYDYYDPTDSDDETESDRYRRVRIYPSITTTPVTINVDYIQDVSELDDDADEPLMPIGDRVVLYYGAGALAWSIISRNEEMSNKWQGLYNAKLARMAGEREDGLDVPSLAPTSNYVNTIRRAGLRSRRVNASVTGGGSSTSLPTYLQDVIINGAAVRGNITVDADITIDGRDISEDGETLDGIAGQTSVTLADNTTNGVIAAFTLTEEDTIHLRYSIKRGSAKEAGMITLMGGATAAMAQGGIVQIGGSAGVSISADISGGTVRLLYTTTNTGSDATFKYQQVKWLS